MTPTRAKALVQEAYQSGQIKASWLAKQLPDRPDDTTVRRWLQGKTSASDSRWIQMYSSLSIGIARENPVSEDAFQLSLMILRDGATAEAKALAAKIIAEARVGYKL